MNSESDAGKQMVQAPKLAMPNFIEDLSELKSFAITHGFSGIDWSFDINQLPRTPASASQWANRQRSLAPLEIRYHCPFLKVDIGHESADERAAARDIFKKILYLVAKAQGRFLTIHVGLGRDTTRILSWESTIASLRSLVQAGVGYGITICLENLTWGWTSKPNLFEKLVRRSGAGVTFDIGHAHACDAIDSQQYSPADFVAPHLNRVFNAHVYHTEIPGTGHVAPSGMDDISSRLKLLERTPCQWWVLELRETNSLLQTKAIIDKYLNANETNRIAGLQAV